MDDTAIVEDMNDENGNPLFAFQHLDYIPFGFSSNEAPYIESGPGTMRAAATLMRLNPDPKLTPQKLINTNEKPAATVICDLGCGDGEFQWKEDVSKLIIEVINLLSHINTPASTVPYADGIGIDYNAGLLETAGLNSLNNSSSFKWLIYNFNDDKDDLASQLLTTHLVTHVFIYLTPKQLALPTLRKILTRLCGEGVVVCCHKFFPTYLVPARRDTVMELCLYDRTS